MLANLYIYFYLLLCSIILYNCCKKYKKLTPGNSLNQCFSNKYSIYIVLFLILFIGLRPLNIKFADMLEYNNAYQTALNDRWVFNNEVENIIFDNIFLLFASFGFPSEVFFTFIATIYFTCIYIACKKLFPNHLMLALLVCLTAFSTFSYATNGIKAGAAASIFLVALAYKDKLLISILLAIISWGFHHSMSMILVAYFVSFVYKKTKLYFYLWAICVILAVAHVNYFQVLFAGYTDEKGAGYLLPGTESFLTGFRPDFILYSAAPIIIGYWMIFKKKLHSASYELWLRMYLLTNSVWMLCMYSSFTNRIAYLSWFMYPVVLIYPFLGTIWSNKQYKYAKKVAYYQLAFTVFMELIYYNLIK